jgi:hypothetical protein
MSLACRDWCHQLPYNDHTWTRFKTNFKAAHLDLRLTATTNSASYHGQAHHTAIHNSDDTPPTPPADNTDNQAITQAYLANLAEATLANNTQVSALTATVAQLKLQISTTTTALTASQTALQAANTTRSAHPLPQCCWANVQKPLHCQLMWNGSTVSPPLVGSTTTPDTHDLESTTSLAHQPSTVCVCAASWCFRF